MKSTIGRWKTKQVSVELVNELAISGTIKAVDKFGLLLEVTKGEQRYIPITAIVQVLYKKPVKAKRDAA